MKDLVVTPGTLRVKIFLKCSALFLVNLQIISSQFIYNRLLEFFLFLPPVIYDQSDCTWQLCTF